MDKYLEEKYRLHEPSWQAAYPLFSAVINEHHLNTGAEVGVAFGGHSEAILRQTNVNKLYSVDRYLHDPNYKDPLNYSSEQFDQLYEFVKARLSVYGDRSELLRLESEQAAQQVPSGIDFVYIDADHSYDGIFRDLCLWSCKVRDGGVIGGHDYGHESFPGVKKAVDQFFDRFGWKKHELGEGVWWVRKERLAISFVVPVFNSGHTIGETIDSIYAENFHIDDELIIVNDSSSDDTEDVIRQYSRKYKDIKIFGHKYNRGTAAAGRNTGIENASNPLIFCLDADNVLQPGSIKELKEYLFSKGADVAAFGETQYFTNATQQITHKWVFKETITLADALAGNLWPGPGGNYMFTVESWLRAGRYYEPYLENQTLDSWIFGIRQLGTGSRMVTLPHTWYFHRHGLESHYIRNYKRGNQSLAALIGLIPFLDLVEEKDIEYIFSRGGRYDWYEKLSQHPVKIKSHRIGKNGRVEQDHVQRKTLTNRIKTILRKVYHRLQKFF